MQGFTNAAAALEYAYRFEEALKVYENAAEVFSADVEKRSSLVLFMAKNLQNQAALAFMDEKFDVLF